MAPGLIADWALWGKEPHTNSGYRVLAAHPPGRSADFNTAVHHWSPGTPAPGDQLPWITIGCTTGPDGTRTVGVFLLDGTAAVDRTNRPIYRISHFAVPVADVGEAGLGWCGLARAALEAAPRLSEGGTGPAELPVPGDGGLLTDIGPRVTPRVSEITGWLAAAAAHLLDGTVVVTGDRRYEPLELLLALDCVAALLPYGMRGSLSAATWTSSGSEVPMRLYWGVADDSPGLTCLAWGGGLPDLGTLSPQARTYHDLIIKNWTVHGGEAVLRHLAAARGPLDITGPTAHADALRVLHALDPAVAVAHEVSEGREVDNERIDLALSRRRIDPGSLQVLAGRKLEGQSTDMGPLAAHMAEPGVSQAFRERLIADLLGGKQDVALRNFESARAATSLTKEDLKPLDEILAFAIGQVHNTCADTEPDPVAERLLPAVAPFAEGTMEFTQCLLYDVPGLAGRLVRALCDGPDPAGTVLAWLRWLGDGAAPEVEHNPELRLLHDLLSTGTCPPGATRKWAAGHPEAAARLLEAAARCGRTDGLLHTDFFHGLTGCAARTASSAAEEPSRAPLRHALERPPAGMRPETAARWDVLCALAGLPPSGFGTLASAAELPGSGGPIGRVGTYTATLRAELELRSLRQHAPAVVGLLLEHALAVDPHTGEGPGPTGHDLTLRILDWQGPCARLVLDAVHRLATGAPHWKEGPEDRRWLERLTARLPQLRSDLAVREVHRAAARAGETREDCETLAARACKARRAGAENDQLCAALQAWAAQGHVGERVLTVLDAYHREWVAFGGASRADEERDDLEGAFARGGTDRRVWQHYRDHAIRRLTQLKTDRAQQIRKLEDDQSKCEQEIRRLRRLDATAAHGRG
ncbi:hypothetical protein [Streptomyces sp. NPDC096152]|uniref:hypothetical protein n=1 Tax=Streptomyces sp. NPDC096152 TaxID=3366078 RepID=UPI003801F02D